MEFLSAAVSLKSSHFIYLICFYFFGDAARYLIRNYSYHKEKNLITRKTAVDSITHKLINKNGIVYIGVTKR